MERGASNRQRIRADLVKTRQGSYVPHANPTPLQIHSFPHPPLSKWFASDVISLFYVYFLFRMYSLGEPYVKVTSS